MPGTMQLNHQGEVVVSAASALSCLHADHKAWPLRVQKPQLVRMSKTIEVSGKRTPVTRQLTGVCWHCAYNMLSTLTSLMGRPATDAMRSNAACWLAAK